MLQYFINSAEIRQRGGGGVVIIFFFSFFKILSCIIVEEAIIRSMYQALKLLK